MKSRDALWQFAIPNGFSGIISRGVLLLTSLKEWVKKETWFL
jgi:hypothetical protein